MWLSDNYKFQKPEENNSWKILFMESLIKILACPMNIF